MDLELRKKALDFATTKHLGQKRKDGKDYITHPIAVAEIAIQIYSEIIDEFAANDDIKGSSFYEEFLDELYVVSLLHDTREDTDTTKREIELEFGYHMASAVEILTRHEGQTYFDFIMLLIKEHDFLPVYVKLADLKHNMSDLNEGSLKDKYRFAYMVLMDTVRETIGNLNH